MGFRQRLMEGNLDRRLVERTVELAARTGGFGARALRAALDSSPLWGAGRVEDTFNLMGRDYALRKALGVIAAVQGRGQAAVTPATDGGVRVIGVWATARGAHGPTPLRLPGPIVWCHEI